MLEIIIDNHTPFALLIFTGTLTKTLGKRFSLTREHWQSLSYINKYGQCIFGFPTAAITLYLPQVTSILEPNSSLGVNPLLLLIGLCIVMALFSLFTGAVLCIGGPRTLRAEGKTWR